jgi:hypothetical protein
MYESVKAGHIKHEASYDTLSDGTAGDIEDGSVKGVEVVQFCGPFMPNKCCHFYFLKMIFTLELLLQFHFLKLIFCHIHKHSFAELCW